MPELLVPRGTLMSIAKHYETGESLTEDICLKLISTRTFHAGSLMLRQVNWSMLISILVLFLQIPCRFVLLPLLQNLSKLFLSTNDGFNFFFELGMILQSSPPGHPFAEDKKIYLYLI